MGADDRTTITLQTPITWGKETKTELVFRAPRGKEIRRFLNERGGSGEREGDALFSLAAACCGESPRVLDELSAEDTIGVLDHVGKLMPDGLGTGASPSGSSLTTSDGDAPSSTT